MDATVLHNACEIGDTDEIEKLLSRGVDPTERNKRHETAFHVACKSPKCGLPVLEHMVKYMPEKVDVYRDADGRTPLHTALCCKKRDFALYLIKNRYCSAFALNKAQVTPLYLACPVVIRTYGPEHGCHCAA